MIKKFFMKYRIPILVLLLAVGLHIDERRTLVPPEYMNLLHNAARETGINGDWDSSGNPLEAVDRFAMALYGNERNPVENVMFREARMAFDNNTHVKNQAVDVQKYENMLDILVQTEKYVNAYNVAQRERDGCDYVKCRAEIPDAETGTRVAEELKEKLKRVDRKRALAGIYLKVCGNWELNKENHVKLLNHLQRISFHSPDGFDFADCDGETVYDPLVLLEGKLMKCGQVNRLACDFADAIGAKARVCQLGGHVTAELYYEGSWHHFDADLFSFGSFIEMKGRIPSLEELSEDCYRVDFLSPMLEYYLTVNDNEINNEIGWGYFSYNYFCEKAYDEKGPLYYYKTATDIECLNKYYGWNYYDIVANPMKLTAEIYLHPGVPYIEDINLRGGTLPVFNVCGWG